MDKHRLSQEFYEYLTDRILPFWEERRDDLSGVFSGLSFFSETYLLLGGEEVKTLASAGKNERLARECLENAEHAYRLLTENCVDKRFGGVFGIAEDGTVAEDGVKYTGCQANAIYALASYFDATGDINAYRQACGLADIIESACTDEAGYLEAFNSDLTPVGTVKAPDGTAVGRTLGTLLDVIDAYTKLLYVTGRRLGPEDGELQERTLFEDTGKSVFDKLCRITDIVVNKIYNPILRRQEVLLDLKYRPVMDIHSYGHDIRASWQLERALEVMDDIACRIELEPIIEALAEQVYDEAYADHLLIAERRNGVADTDCVRWVQADAIVGFTNEGMKCLATGELGTADQFLEASSDIWNSVREKPTDGCDGRMCIEMIRRLG